MDKIDYEEEYQKIKQNVIDFLGYCEDDMDDEEIEDDVNRTADEIFYTKFNIEYTDL